LKQAGVALNPEFICEAEFELEFAEAAVGSLLRRGNRSEAETRLGRGT